MAFRFARSMIRHWWAQFLGYEVIAPKAIQAYRNTRCSYECEFFDDGQCSICKCLTLAKTMMALEECPKGRWHRVWIKTTRRFWPTV